ncbi:substance-P receptor-like [Orbicella faveolata]|uniref:substance-P receptor-like n=1 Tax=Orbicella faveolata TaxID=48498 RepID=UPI0009E20FDF|nr:substance-P receptor-like [Orbicella faveolata]
MTINFNLCFSLVNTTIFVKETHFQLLWLLHVAYIATFLASLFGNSVIIHIIRTDNSMKTTTNYLILNQACADLMITLAEGMNVIHYSLMNNSWLGGLLGLITCKVFLAVIFSFHMFSLWVLATIAVERFYAVTRPLRSSPVSQHLKKIIFLLWATCLATPLNFLQNASFKKLNDCYYCDLTDVLQEWTIINIITGGLLAFLPFLVIAALYAKVCLTLWSRQVPGEGSSQNAQQVEAVKTARKVTLMMIVVTVFYIVCWLPLFISVILEYINYLELNGSLLLFVLWLISTYSGLNPYVYLTFNQKFGNGFHKLFRNCRRKIKIRNLNVVSLRFQSFELEHM